MTDTINRINNLVALHLATERPEIERMLAQGIVTADEVLEAIEAYVAGSSSSLRVMLGHEEPVHAILEISDCAVEMEGAIAASQPATSKGRRS